MIVYEDDVLASICRESFFEFFKEFWDVIVAEPLVPNWHMEYLCQELQLAAERVFRGEPKEYDIIINIPPGSTKSTIVSQMFPAWCWTRFPPAKFICGSYAQPLALKDSLKTRDIVQSEKYQKCFGIQLREDENTKGLFTNTETGFRLSVGVGGLVMGFHGHFLIIDDPINPEEACSEAELKATNRWMRTTLPSRKVDKEVSLTILVQQRLHDGDPSGEMLARSNGKGIRHICLPGELTTRENQGVKPAELSERYQDRLLDPVRLSRPVLEKMFEELGSYAYAAQILQDPVPLGGGMFDVDKIHIMAEAPSMVREVRSWDKAGTADGGAYSVGVRIGVDALNRFWITDIRRGQWSSTVRENRILMTAEDDGSEIPIIIEVEGGSGGKESGENTIRNLAGFRVGAFHPTGDKEQRAWPLSVQVGAGNLYLLKRDWNKVLIEELRYFPNSRFKDQTDAAAQGFNHIARKKRKIGAMW